MASAGPTGLPGGNSEWEPPESIPNSEVKTLSADDSVGLPHVKVGHCRAFIPESPEGEILRGFFLVRSKNTSLAKYSLETRP